MNKHKRTHRGVEIVKNIVIVLLIICAVFLGWESRLFGNTSGRMSSLADLLRNISGTDPAGSQGAPQNTDEPDKPVAIAVTDSAGGRYGARYDMQDVKLAYSKTFLFISEALGTAQSADDSDDASWRAALKSQGIYYEYMTPVRLSVLGDWLGVSVSDSIKDLAVRRLCVTDDGSDKRLYFQDDGTGKFYSAVTELRGDIAGLTGEFTENDAFFAFERGLVKAPYALLIPNTMHPQLEAKNPLNDKKTQDAVLLSLGVSELQKSSYKIGKTDVYIGDKFILYLSPDGTIDYNWTAEEATASDGPVNENEAIRLASLQVMDTVGKFCGDNAVFDVYYDSVSATDDGGFRVLFRYVAAGGAVWLQPDGYAAQATVKNDRITSMKLRCRSYAVSSQPSTAALLPELQAAAAADGDYILTYNDTGSAEDGTALLAPFWLNLPQDT